MGSPVDHQAIDDAEADLRAALAAASARAPTDVEECSAACLALHRRELSRVLALLQRATDLLTTERQEAMTWAERCRWKNDVDELLAEIDPPKDEVTP
jgi:hypothetical protein